MGSLCLDLHQKITVHCSPLNPKSAFILQSLNRSQVLFLCWSFRVLCCSPVSHWALRADSVPARSRHTHISMYLFTSSAVKFSDHCWPSWEIHWFGQKYQNSHAYLCLSSLSLSDIPREGSSLLKHLKSMYNPLILNLSFELQHPPQITPPALKSTLLLPAHRPHLSSLFQLWDSCKISHCSLSGGF